MGSSYLHPGEPLVSEHEHVLGSHVLARLAHGGQEGGGGLEHRQSRDALVAQNCGTLSCGFCPKVLELADKALAVDAQTDGLTLAGLEPAGRELRPVQPFAVQLEALGIGGLDGALDGVELSHSHQSAASARTCGPSLPSPGKRTGSTPISLSRQRSHSNS